MSSTICSLAVRTGFLLLLFLFIPSTVVNAQHTVSGQVLSSAGGVSGVTISLIQEGNPVGWTTQTNGEGNYSLGTVTLAAGSTNVVITASKPDYVFIPATKSLALTANVNLNFAATLKVNPDPIVKIVEARAEPMDSITAANRFGKVTNKQYHIANIGIFNKLADLKNGSVVGDSIVVSSASVRVPVNFEVRYIGKRVAHLDRKIWHARDFEKVSGVDITQTLDATKWGNYTTTRDSEIAENKGDSKCTQKPEYVRPYRFEQMIGTVDRRESRETRSKILLIAESAATLTSFVTSFIVPINTNDTPTILDKFKNLLIPSYKEYFPSLKDEHRKNLTEDIMKPLESIAFKQHLDKTIFLPKAPWKDGEWEYRISHICADPIQIEAVVAKPGDQLPIHTLVGVVIDAETRTGVPNVKLSLIGGSIAPFEAVTNAMGQYAFSGLPAGTYTVTAGELVDCKRSKSESIGIPLPAAAGLSTKNFELPGMYNLSGSVTRSDGITAIDQATVELRGSNGNVLATTKTSAAGTYEFSCKEKAAYQIVVTKPGAVPALTFTALPVPPASLGTPIPRIQSAQ